MTVGCADVEYREGNGCIGPRRRAHIPIALRMFAPHSGHGCAIVLSFDSQRLRAPTVISDDPIPAVVNSAT
jgi:hypothetical protein